MNARTLINVSILIASLSLSEKPCDAENFHIFNDRTVLGYSRKDGSGGFGLNLDPAESSPWLRLIFDSNAGTGSVGNNWIMPLVDAKALALDRGRVCVLLPTGEFVNLQCNIQSNMIYHSLDKRWQGRVDENGGFDLHAKSGEIACFRRGRISRMSNQKNVELIWKFNGDSSCKVTESQSGKDIFDISLRDGLVERLKHEGRDYQFKYSDSPVFGLRDRNVFIVGP